MEKGDKVTLEICGETNSFKVVQVLEDGRVIVVDEDGHEYIYRKSRLSLVHPKEVVDSKLVKLIKILKDEMVVNDKHIEQFKNELDKDPVFALRWSAKTFEAVTLNSVIKKVLRGFERGNTIEFTIGFHEHIMSNTVLRTSQNSNVTVDLTERFEISATVRVLKIIKELGC